jgi:hypothetical protein
MAGLGAAREAADHQSSGSEHPELGVRRGLAQAVVAKFQQTFSTTSEAEASTEESSNLLVIS